MEEHFQHLILRIFGHNRMGKPLKNDGFRMEMMEGGSQDTSQHSIHGREGRTVSRAIVKTLLCLDGSCEHMHETLPVGENHAGGKKSPVRRDANP